MQAWRGQAAVLTWRGHAAAQMWRGHTAAGVPGQCRQAKHGEATLPGRPGGATGHIGGARRRVAGRKVSQAVLRHLRLELEQRLAVGHPSRRRFGV